MVSRAEKFSTHMQLVVILANFVIYLIFYQECSKTEITDRFDNSFTSFWISQNRLNWPIKKQEISFNDAVKLELYPSNLFCILLRKQP